jgi:hypothetical protein
VIDGAMNGQMFDLYIESQLVATLCEGDVVILDNLSSYKSPARATSARSSCSCRPIAQI